MTVSVGPRHSKTYFQSYADSKSPDQSAHAQSDQSIRCPLTET